MPWGFEEIELLPLRLFVVATKVGGQAFGAFDGKRMVGRAEGLGISRGRKQLVRAAHVVPIGQYYDFGSHFGRAAVNVDRDNKV
jgi:predicted GNAT superfamily acetyltransferase